MPVFLFLTIYSVVPEKVTLMEGESLDLKRGITATAHAVKKDSYSLDVRLLNVIPIKTVDVRVLPKTALIPSGEAIGVKLFCDGVLVVGISDVKMGNGDFKEPAKDAGILVGDRILEVDGKKVSGIDDFVEKINDTKGVSALLIARGEDSFIKNLAPVYSEESRDYKVGLWVRDSTAGIGTLTFYNPETRTFGALGHGICDSDTKELMSVRTGSISRCNIRNVIKGKKGIAGELTGEFSGNDIGEITGNTSSGILGKANEIPDIQPVFAASRFDVQKGDAEILCDVTGNGPQSYKIEITKISLKSEEKNMVLKVTDERLITKTGGIVQGMSGSPILQNGKIVGAVTHVFVNDPQKGYGIFIENMLYN